MKNGFTRFGLSLAMLCAVPLLPVPGFVPAAKAVAAGENGTASAWQEAQMSQVRLLAGRQGSDGEKIVAGIEIALEDGWKTYWRTPGDAGGVPPEVDWTTSENVKETQLLYPAPKRFKDKAGETIGYKGSVVLPVLVEPEDPNRPVELSAQFHFGICREICVPVTADLKLSVSPDLEPGLPEELAAALTRTPRRGDQVRSSDPKLVAYEVVLEGAKPRIVLEVDLGRGAETGDVFVEASDGVYLPMAQRVKDGNSQASRFEINLLEANDPAELKGKTVRVTMVGPEGQSEARFVVE
jgi:DsbC/DsbD-like thiol-disulfide interchange protein